MPIIHRKVQMWCAGIVFTFAGAGTFFSGAAGAQVPDPVFTIGVLPNVSARVILQNYQPMRAFFERELKRRVEIATASDFRSFSAATIRGDYQMVVTAANLGRVAQLDAGWEAIAVYEPAIPGLLVAGSENANVSLEQLRGKSLALRTRNRWWPCAGCNGCARRACRMGAISRSCWPAMTTASASSFVRARHQWRS